MVHKALTTSFFICLLILGSCSNSSPVIQKKPGLTSKSRVKVLGEKLFPLVDYLDDHPGSYVRIRKTLVASSRRKPIRARYTEALERCPDASCLALAMKIDDSDFDGLEDEEGRLYLRESIIAVNHIIDTYLGARPPRYAEIDGPAFKANDSTYFRSVQKTMGTLLKKAGRDRSQFVLPIQAALALLALNGRDEAARYEPITGGINKEVKPTLKKIRWQKYQYSAILVPGLGPNKEGVALDPGGARRCDMAAERYLKGEAPVIIVSGGHVHPARTPYSEAIEMKKYLTSNFKIPAGAVIAEPYARHTTTNIRNAARLIYKFGIPADKPVMIVTDFGQSTFIMFMRGRFMQELGYLPYKSLTRERNGPPVFVPDSSALRLNPRDPLDP